MKQKAIAFAIGTLLLILGAYVWWALQARSLQAEVTDWLDKRRAAGWEAQVDDITVRGFPNRLDLTLSGILLADPQSGIVYEAPLFQALSLSYKRDHLILAFADSQTLTIKGTRHDITSDGLRASIVSDNGTMLRARLESTVLNIQSPDSAAALSNLFAAFEQMDSPTRFQTIVQTDALALSQGTLPRPGSDTPVAARMLAEVTFDAPFHLPIVDTPRPQPTQITITDSDMRVSGLTLKLAGAADVDPSGVLDGAFTLRAEDWQTQIAALRASDDAPDWFVDMLDTGLGFLSALNGRADTLDTPLNITNGQFAIGIIPIGPAPRVRLP